MALETSETLIVLCSPFAAKSFQVNEEIRLFKWRHPERLIVPVIADGKPGDLARECFPPALRFKIASDGTITDKSEPGILAADVRPEGDGRELALAKVFAGQQDGVVGEVELDLVERKIGPVDHVCVDGMTIAVFAGEFGAAVGGDGERPKLESFGGDSFFVPPRDRDGVEKPIGSAGVGDVLRTIGEDNLAVDGMAIPVLAAGELAEIAFGECFFHVEALFVVKGRRMAASMPGPAPAEKRACQQGEAPRRNGGNLPPCGRGEPFGVDVTARGGSFGISEARQPDANGGTPNHPL
jgi:hypothetical protein